MNEPAITGRVERLRQFFKAMHEDAEQPRHVGQIFSSLKLFFGDFAQYRAAIEAAANSKEARDRGSSIDPARLTEFIEAFSLLAQHLQKCGEFIDVWEVAGLRRNELRNTAVLAWLLDSKQTHGRGSAILNAFIRVLANRHVAHRQGKFPLPSYINGSYSVATESYSLGNMERRVDIVIDGTDFVMFIEVKIDAGERPDQLADNLSIVAARAKTLGIEDYALVFLQPARLSRHEPYFIAATWSDVADAIDHALITDKSDKSDDFGDRLLKQFSRRIRQF